MPYGTEAREAIIAIGNIVFHLSGSASNIIIELEDNDSRAMPRISPYIPNATRPIEWPVRNDACSLRKVHVYMNRFVVLNIDNHWCFESSKRIHYPQSRKSLAFAWPFLILFYNIFYIKLEQGEIWNIH